MLIRVLHYLTSLYLDHLATYGVKNIERLPAALPLVLYNGDRSWTAPTSITDLIEDYPALGDYQIQFQYLKIAENEFTLNQLMGFRNIVSALFIAEAYYDLPRLQEILLALYDEEPDREALQIFRVRTTFLALRRTF